MRAVFSVLTFTVIFLHHLILIRKKKKQFSQLKLQMDFENAVHSSEDLNKYRERGKKPSCLWRL